MKGANRHSREWTVLPLLLAALLLSLMAGLVHADPQIPALTGRVVDFAGLLSREQVASITGKLAALEEKSTDQLVVVTLDSLQGYEIEEFGVALGRAWQIGQKNKNNGVLLIVAPNERKVRIEVGYGLEGVLTDTLAGDIVRNRILPTFRAGRMADGIVIGVDDIIATLTGNAEEVAERAKGERRDDSGGGFDPVGALILMVWAFIFFGNLSRVMFPASADKGGVIIVPYVPPSSGGWSGGSHGGGSWGGGGGGGFSGGGGSFGGGGSSGSW